MFKYLDMYVCMDKHVFSSLLCPTNFRKPSVLSRSSHYVFMHIGIVLDARALPIRKIVCHNYVRSTDYFPVRVSGAILAKHVILVHMYFTWMPAYGANSDTNGRSETANPAPPHTWGTKSNTGPGQY